MMDQREMERLLALPPPSEGRYERDSPTLPLSALPRPRRRSGVLRGGALAIVLTVAAGSLLVGRWIGTPGPSATVAAVPVRTQVSDDHYELVLELPKSTWHTNEAITGMATLHLVKPTTMTVWGSGGGLIGFKYAAAGGDKTLDWLPSMDCVASDLAAGSAVVAPLAKSFQYSADAPPTDFYRIWGEDPLIHLPVGDWTISAVTDFTEVNCGGDLRHSLVATLAIHVVP